MVGTTTKRLAVVFLVAVLAASGGGSSTRAGTIADEFDVAHDYSGGNVAGTIWSGVLNPDSLRIGDASITQPGRLTLSATPFSGWGQMIATGPALYTDVAGDFDVSVQVTSMTNVLWSDGGLIVRAPVPAGSPENWVGERYFGAGGFNSTRSLVDDIETDWDTPGLDSWLRITRSGRRFAFFTRPDDSSGWILRQTLIRDDLGAMANLQVGLWFAAFTDPSGNGNIGTAQFDHFRLTTEVATVPEPASLILAGVGTLAVAASAIRRRTADRSIDSP